MLLKTTIDLSTGFVRKFYWWGLAVLLTLICSWSSSFGQDQCFDPGGDCTLSSPQQFDVPVEVTCGDTVMLLATQELCNTWTVPEDVQYFPGIGEDSTSIYVIVDRCAFDDIIVDGITETPSGSGTASCDRRLIYQLYSRKKIISMLWLNAKVKEHLLDVCKYGYWFSSESHQDSKQTVNQVRSSQQNIV